MKSNLRTNLGILVLLAFSAATLYGCKCDVSLNKNKKSETDMGTHHVVVKPGATFTSSSSMTGGDQSRYTFKCGDVAVAILDEQLIVNGKTYGVLKENDSILIDNGVVHVEGKKVEGKALSAEEQVELGLVEKETTEELAGYSVTVRPGSRSTIKVNFLGKKTLTVGDVKVAIKDDKLFVNGKPYGTLKAGDTILVEYGNVFVSGEQR